MTFITKQIMTTDADAELVQLVERYPSKLDVVGSIPILRLNL